VRGAARRLYLDVQNEASKGRALVADIEKLLGQIEASVKAFRCSAARTDAGKAESKLRQLITIAEKLGNKGSEAGGMISQSFGDEEVQTINLRVSTLISEIHAMTSGVGGAVANARAKANACKAPAPPPLVVPPAPKPVPAPVAKPPVKLSSMLALGGLAAVVAGGGYYFGKKKGWFA
jgi:outer membrane murein-binding lipoprotein Lpp